MPGPDELPQLLTMDGLAERLGVRHRHVRRLVDERRAPFLEVGRLVRFDPTEVAEWLRSTHVPAAHVSATEISPSRALQVGDPVPRAKEREVTGERCWEGNDTFAGSGRLAATKKSGG